MGSPQTRVPTEISEVVAKLKRLAAIDRAAGSSALISKANQAIDQLLQGVANA